LTITVQDKLISCISVAGIYIVLPYQTKIMVLNPQQGIIV